MVRRLSAVLHLAEALVAAGGRLADGLGEELGVHEVGAGAGGQVASVLHQLQAPHIDLPVALDGVLHGGPGFGEGGGIQNDYVKFFALPLQLREQVKDVGAEKLHPVGEAVEFGVLPGLGHPQLGGVHPQDGGRPGDAGVQGEGAGVGEAVQHFGSPAEALNRQPVVFLVQEEAGFLAVLDVHQIFHPVLLNLNLGVEGLADEALEALHPLLEADFGVAALVDAPDGDAVLRQNLF